MTQHGRWLRLWGGGSLALLTLGLTGCLSFLHPIDPKNQQPEPVAECKEIPVACRNRVHVFLIHGLDPLDFANLSGVSEYVHTLGFIKTHYGQLYHIWQFKKEVRRIHKEDPEARFVLIGFSFGANMVRNLANAAREEKIGIDLLVYLGGNTLDNTEPNRPDNVVRIVNILAHGWVWNGASLDGAENLQYDDVWHFGSPTHIATIDVLARELAVVARHVPIVDRDDPWVPTGPTPRRLPPPLPGPGQQALPAPRPEGKQAVPGQQAQTPAPRDAWDFLKSDGVPSGPMQGGSPTRLATDGPPATLKDR